MPVPGVYAASSQNEPLRQGEILSNVVQWRLEISGLHAFPTNDEPAPFSRVEHPLVIVISQDCDLDWDHKSRQSENEGKELPSVLLCEVVEAQDLPSVNAGIWKRIKINKEDRYQFLERVPTECDALQQGLPEMAMDFKRCFSIPTAELYFQLKAQAQRRCRLSSPYLEHFSQRLFGFHARVGLPADHFSEPSLVQ